MIIIITINKITYFLLGPYVDALKQVERDTLATQKLINEKMGIKESDTGLS